jgi:DNA-binding PadR family transcriptional regulator
MPHCREVDATAGARKRKKRYTNTEAGVIVIRPVLRKERIRRDNTANFDAC